MSCIKRLETPNVDENMEKQTICTIDGNVTWCCPYGNSSDSYFKKEMSWVREIIQWERHLLSMMLSQFQYSAIHLVPLNLIVVIDL